MTEKRTRSQSRTRPRAQQSSPMNDHKPQLYKTQGMLFGDLDPVRYDKSVDPPVKACFNCWSLEHYRKECCEPCTFYYCCNCGRKELKVDVCPRCARAFQALPDVRKNWIYDTFYNIESNQTEDRQHTKEDTRDHEERWDECDKKDDYQYSCQSADEYGKKAEDKNKSNEIEDKDFDWEPMKSYHSRTTEPNDLFVYMRHKKIIDEFENNKLNNIPVNLDETRMADRDSFGENSILSIDFSEDITSYLNGQPINDMRILLKAVTYLPTQIQNSIVLHVVREPQTQMAIRNILLLIKAVGHLPVPTQIETFLQITSERKQQMAENEMGFVNKQKSP